MALGNAAVLVLGLVASVVAARALGPTARGEFFGSSSIAVLISMALGLGCVQAIVTFRGQDIPHRGLLIQVLLAGAACAVVMTLLSVTSIQPWLSLLGVAGCALWCVASLLSSFSASLAQRRGDMTRGYQNVRLGPQAASVACMLGLAIVAVGGSNEWMFLTGVGMVLVAAVQYRSSSRLSVSRVGSSAVVDADLPRSFVGEARATTPAMLATLAFNRVDVALVSILFAPQQIAMYAIAVAALGACTALGTAVGMVTFSRLGESGFTEHSGRYVAVSLARAMGSSAVAATIVVVLAPTLIHVFYGRDFLEATDATRLLALGAIPSSAAYLLFHVMLLLDQRRAVTWNYTLGSVLIAIGVVIASVGASLDVAALSVTVSYALLTCLLWAWVRRGLKSHALSRTQERSSA